MRLTATRSSGLGRNAAAVLAGVGATAMIALAAQYPRTLTATATTKGAAAAIEATVTIHVDRLMEEEDYKRVADALRYGGYPKFLEALRSLPVVGRLEAGRQKADLKYARVRTTDKGEMLVVGADRPVYFLGSGEPEAKSRAGYETAFLQLEIDASGAGQGTMAAAARVKPGGGGSVVIDDYATDPIRLTLKPSAATRQP